MYVSFTTNNIKRQRIEPIVVNNEYVVILTSRKSASLKPPVQRYSCCVCSRRTLPSKMALWFGHSAGFFTAQNDSTTRRDVMKTIPKS